MTVPPCKSAVRARQLPLLFPESLFSAI
jgi:hypothetical protein